MSHFTVAVITKKNSRKEIEKILEPYWEELEVEPYIGETKEQLIKNAKRLQKLYLERQEKGESMSEYESKYINATTDEELYEAYKDEDEKYDEQGNRLTTYNPKSKWDWYSIGGRWNKVLLTNKDNKDVLEEQDFGLFNYCDDKETIDGYKWVNGAKIKDINFEKMNEGKEKPFYTWALVDEIDWYEQGKMGWWATSDATNESTNTFAKQFQEYINNLDNQEKYLTIVDCHI